MWFFVFSVSGTSCQQKVRFAPSGFVRPPSTTEHPHGLCPVKACFPHISPQSTLLFNAIFQSREKRNRLKQIIALRLVSKNAVCQNCKFCLHLPYNIALAFHFQLKTWLHIIFGITGGWPVSKSIDASEKLIGIWKFAQLANDDLLITETRAEHRKNWSRNISCWQGTRLFSLILTPALILIEIEVRAANMEVFDTGPSWSKHFVEQLWFLRKDMSEPSSSPQSPHRAFVPSGLFSSSSPPLMVKAFFNVHVRMVAT